MAFKTLLKAAAKKGLKPKAKTKTPTNKLAGKVFGPKTKPTAGRIAPTRGSIGGKPINKKEPMFKSFTPTMLNFDKYVKKLRKGQELTKREKIAFVKSALAEDKVSIVDGRSMLTSAQFAKIQGMSDEQLLKKFDRLSREESLRIKKFRKSIR
tara:strand:+ start:3142 stop:3600 length:459 start_codon:yes stop_codon:yes gene_type:complete